MSTKTGTQTNFIAFSKKQTKFDNQTNAYLQKWFKGDLTKSAQYRAGQRGAKIAIEQYGDTLRWLGGGDKE